MDGVRRALEQNPDWYHTIELAPGVMTPGLVDLRPLASKALPSDLTGKRALDVGTFDGHWAFEMERRGADVVATDVEQFDHADWPSIHRARLVASVDQMNLELGRGFRLAADALGSSVRRVPCNVYDLSPDAIDGPVDFAIVGALLLHLRDPVKALEHVRSTLVPGGELRLVEPFSLWLTIASPRRPAARFRVLETKFTWWLANRAAIWAWVVAAGFEQVRRVAIARPPGAKGMRQWQLVLAAKHPASQV